MSINQTPHTELGNVYGELPDEVAAGIAANRDSMQGFFDQPANNAGGAEAAATTTRQYETGDPAATQELPVVTDARPYSSFDREVAKTWTQGDPSVDWGEASAHTSERIARKAGLGSLGSAALTLAGVAVIATGASSGNEKMAIAGVVATTANMAAGKVQQRVRSWARNR